MEIYDLIIRQQQIAQEKSSKAVILPTRDYYDLLKGMCDSFLLKKEGKELFIMPGLRGIGKTTMLLQLYDYLKNKVPQNRLFFFSLDEANKFNISLSDLQTKIEKEIVNKPLSLVKDKMIFFLDEIQYSEKWSLSLKLLYDQGENIFIVATGSSALKLKESADLARRRILKPIYPLRFREYLLLQGIKMPQFDWLKLFVNADYKSLENFWKRNQDYKITGMVNDYLYNGGFPFKKEEATEKVQDLVTKIIHRDIEQSIEDVDTIQVERLVNYLAISRAGETSMEKLANKVGISKPSVMKYLDFLERAELLFSVKPYSASSESVRKANKYYFANASLKAALLAKISPAIHRDETVGELLESAVFSSINSYLTEQNQAFQIFFDPQGSDFIIRLESGRKIVVEVKKGSSKGSQLNKTMKRIDADLGITVSASPLRKTDNQLMIPIELFLLI
jgi:predicted AAA+ superfamily ATPase